MSWRDQYRQGSFRGAAFRTQSAEQSGGRRGETHEFPGRDIPYREDLGRRAGAFNFSCWVGGLDYYAARAKLIAALDAAGPGTLVHPFRGEMIVSVIEWTCNEDAADGGGGIADFSISFVESGSVSLEAAKPATGDQARSVADAEAAAAPAKLAKKLNVAKLAAFVEKAAADVTKAAAFAVQVQAAIQGGGIGAALRAFESGLRFLPGVEALVRDPLALGQSIVGMVQTVSALGNPLGRIAAFASIAQFGADLAPVTGDTPARTRQRDNQAALVTLVQTAASAEMVRAIADSNFSSYEDAVATRDAAAELLDGFALAAADAGDDDATASFDRLRHAMVRDVTARGGSLARLRELATITAEPALVIAQRIYGDPVRVERQAAELVARNAVRHPGFVPGGITLQVLTEDGASG